MAKKPAAPKTRNFGTMTDAQFFGRLKNLLRAWSIQWKPGEEYLKKKRRLHKGQGRQTYEYQCERCLKWFSRKEVEKDHIVDVGVPTSFKEFGEMVERLFIEIDGGWQCLCIPCHDKKSGVSRRRKK